MKHRPASPRSLRPRPITMSVALACAALVSGTLAFDACAAGGVASGPAASAFATVAGSTRLHQGEAVIGALPMEQPIHVEVALKLRNRELLDAFIANNARNQVSGNAVQSMTSAQVLANHAPTQAQAQRVVDYLARSGFSNIAIAPNRLLVSADGTASSARAAFTTSFAQVRTRDGRIAFANIDDVRIPAALQDTVVAVLGLQTVHQMRTAATGVARGGTMSTPYTPTAKGHDPLDYSSIYGGGGVGTARGVIVGIVTAGALTQTIADLDQFTANNGLATVKTQTYNSNGKSSSDYGEAEWDEDSQAIVGMAGGEVGGIAFYNSPDLTDADLAANFNKVVTVNTAKIISASIGFCETDERNSGATTADDQIFEVGVAQGQTFAFANGDFGADECDNGGTTPLYPAASPYVVAVAGTTLTATATTWSSEVVWNELATKGWASGGSLSTFEPAPSWQKALLPAGSTRGVADVAFDADPNTAEHVIIYGQLQQRGGTSMATPLFAGLWARVIAARGTNVGFAAPLIYGLPASDFHDITVGNDGAESAAVGYDLASGRGSMIAGTVIDDLGGLGHTPPAASFGFTTTGLAAHFSDTSTDSDGTIASHLWRFGDGGTASSANPGHTYAAAGVYDVTETVKDNQSASSLASHTVTIGSAQLLGNPGFETGTAAPWSITANVLVHGPVHAHSGQWFAEIGQGGTGAHTDTVSQWVTIPAGKTSATLSFYLDIGTTDDILPNNDVLSVKVIGPAGATLATLATYDNLSATGQYVLRSLDMTPWIGRKVQIAFVGANNATLQTTWSLDDVTLNVE
ncbi:MAG TPA: protease pro-enzyme activation domain-containing protein [Xanthomonadaceae bacterium]|nr:protease pro-enzyme activation domain-containing protein [Xanthomonadaceae bacterium]